MQDAKDFFYKIDWIRDIVQLLLLHRTYLPTFPYHHHRNRNSFNSLLILCHKKYMCFVIKML
jgi:hypothetical protein